MNFSIPWKEKIKAWLSYLKRRTWRKSDYLSWKNRIQSQNQRSDSGSNGATGVGEQASTMEIWREKEEVFDERGEWSYYTNIYLVKKKTNI